jgi:hypothetical protein
MSKVHGSYIGLFVQVSDSPFFFFYFVLYIYIWIMTKKKHVQLYVCDSVNVILFLLGPAHAKVIRTDQDNVRVKQVQTKHVKQKRKKTRS